MKRRRTDTVARRPARPIDKELIAVAKALTTTVATTVLKTVTFPGTIVGLRWEFSAASSTASDALNTWAIVVVHDGKAVSTPSLTDGSPYYQPEQDVLAFGVGFTLGNAAGSNESATWRGSTKTMRKLKQGDQLVFVGDSNVIGGAAIRGIVQFFFKT